FRGFRGFLTRVFTGLPLGVTRYIRNAYASIVEWSKASPLIIRMAPCGFTGAIHTTGLLGGPMSSVFSISAVSIRFRFSQLLKLAAPFLQRRRRPYSSFMSLFLAVAVAAGLFAGCGS